ASVGLQQTTVELVLLTTWLVDRPAANALKGKPLPQRPPSLGKSPQRKKNPGIPRLRDGSLCANNCAANHALPRDGAVDDITMRMGANNFHLPCHFFWQQKVVCIEILQPLTFRQLKQSVARCTAAAVRTGFPTDPIAELPDNIEATIRRPVVDHNDLF